MHKRATYVGDARAGLHLQPPTQPSFAPTEMDATPAAAAPALGMKLLVDTKAHRVLFAEAGKDVVDFLFSLLALPVATAVKLLGTDSMVGSVGNLYMSVEKLDATFYVEPDPSKDALLRPVVLSPAVGTCSSVLHLPAPSSASAPSNTFTCGNTSYSSCRGYVAEKSGTVCPSCGSKMTTVAQLVSPAAGQVAQNDAAAGGANGFVQGIVTYTVMDDLTVCPMSSISSITLLNTFAVKDIAALQEKTVQLGYKEGLAILKASLQSKTVLTDVFLPPLPQSC
ncbi:hypothetical protein GUJ93_ZPchr0001g32821 [Zizania palustris]|uniref:DUF674 family protein n=1 Tax=Zizania palustris TaxID=103762 RepID=A0A8J5RSI1_ZIZPA|nr:hypothetical protein GUJ93_ZPchr0001g32821 [Zizania palustris]